MNIETAFGPGAKVSEYGEVKRAEVVSATPPPEPGNALARFRTDPAALKASALAVLDLEIANPKTIYDANALAERIAQAKTVYDNIEARRDLIVRPLNEEVRDVNAEAKRWREPLGQWIKRAGTVLVAYRKKAADDARRTENLRQEALSAAATRQGLAEASGDAQGAELAATRVMELEAQGAASTIQGFRTDSGTASVRKRWTIEVVNPSEVPPAYLVPDLKKLQAAVDAHPDPSQLQIDGCHIEEKETLVVRTR